MSRSSSHHHAAAAHDCLPGHYWAPSPSTSQSTRAAISEGGAVRPSGIWAGMIAKVFDRCAGFGWLFLDTIVIFLDSTFLGPDPLMELRPMPKTETTWLPTISKPVSMRWASPFLKRLCG